MNGYQLYELARQLAPLSGMAYHQGSHTAPEWMDITGTDPCDFPGYIRITESGLCVWTPKAEKLYRAYSAQRRANFAVLGV